MQSWLSHIAKRYKVTGDAASTRLVMGTPSMNSNGYATLDPNKKVTIGLMSKMLSLNINGNKT